MVSVLFRDPIPHDREIEGRVEMPIEVVIRNKLLERNEHGSVEGAMFGDTEHAGHLWK